MELMRTLREWYGGALLYMVWIEVESLFLILYLLEAICDARGRV